MALTPRGIYHVDPGTVVNLQAITEQMATTTDAAIGDALTPIGQWQSYAPTWAAGTTNPALGNGTLVGRYCRIGKTINFTIALTLGSTTTIGSGAYTFSLPAAAAASTQIPVGVANMRDASSSASSGRAMRTAYLNTPTVIALAAEAGALVTHNVPWTWAANDTLIVSGTYEAA